MIGRSPLLGSTPFVRGRVVTRPGSVLRQHAALAQQRSGRNKRHAGVCAAQLDGENQADEVLQVMRIRTIAIEDMLMHAPCCRSAHGDCCLCARRRCSHPHVQQLRKTIRSRCC